MDRTGLVVPDQGGVVLVEQAADLVVGEEAYIIMT